MNPSITNLRPALSLLVLLTAAPCGAWAQAASEATARPAHESQETDVNEDNYRRFMELRDEQVQRPNQPYAALAPPGDLEKLGRLPEASQKHLRNQLREIILDNGRWSPEEAGKPYPYVPSAAAGEDPALRQLEAEAWSELVENYHAREAEIYAAGERGRSATANAGEDRQAGASGATKGRDGQAADPAGPGAGATGSGADAQRQAGMTQNALHYLTGQGASQSAGRMAQGAGTQGQSVSPSAAPNVAASAASSGPASVAAEPAATQASGQASDQAEANSSERAAADGTDESSPDTATAAGSAQASSAGQSASEGQAPSSESGTQPEVIYRSPGVIAIKDLDQLQGVAGDEDDPAEQDEDDDGH